MDRMLALYEDHRTAVQVRTHLFADGFPADRVEVTATADLGRAGLIPHGNTAEALRKYFTVLFDDDTDGELIDRLSRAVLDGNAAITIHPRGSVEIDRARQILRGHGCRELIERLTPENKNQPLGEYAAGFGRSRSSKHI